jgi:hypothetical protein
MAVGDPVVGNLGPGGTFTPAVGVVVLLTSYGGSSVGSCFATNTGNFHVISPGGSTYFNGRIGLFVTSSNPVTQQVGNGSYSGIQTA